MSGPTLSLLVLSVCLGIMLIGLLLWWMVDDAVCCCKRNKSKPEATGSSPASAEALLGDDAANKSTDASASV